MQSVLKGANFREQSQVLVDVFFNKAPSTLLKRCYGMTKIRSFLKLKAVCFPCDEQNIYDFMCHQRNEGAPSSRLKSCFESLVFCRRMLGITELDGAINSRRCLGTTYRSIHDKVQQASPLTVAQLRYLHQRLEEDSDLWHKAFIGMTLFCCYGRSRWSDSQHCERMITDFDDHGNLMYIECETAVHKTARSLQMKYIFLPLVAPCVGITNRNWGGNWLRMLLIDGKFDISNCKITSHTLKCTFLSYCAKRGISLEDRRILGYHSEGNRVPLRYSRDSASRPLAVLENLIAEIYQDKFRPDCTRSGRLVDSVEKRSLQIKVEDDFQIISDEDEIVEESDYATTSSDESESESHVEPKNLGCFGTNMLHLKELVCGSAKS